MNLKDIKKIDEASYPGNIGAMEVFKFYQVATDDEKAAFNDLLKNRDYETAWNMIQSITGTKLHKTKGKIQ
jgi:hypothetical protein